MKKLLKAIALVLALVLAVGSLVALTGCNKPKAGYEKNPLLDTTKDISLVIATNKETWPEMDAVIAKFEEVYPNCSVVCEYIEDYLTSLAIRLDQSEQKIDIFRTTNIQENTEYKDNALNLISDYAEQYLDLSGTNKGIVANFKYLDADNTQYAIPYGGEMRGMYVNTTLLNKFGLSVPTNRAELMSCCEVLYDNGYIPFHSAPGTFAQQLLYPYICNSIVNGGNYEEMYVSIENIDDGISEYFRDAYTFLYDIVSKGYFDYDRAEKEFGYVYGGSEGKAKDFLNVMQVGDDLYEKKDDVGAIAFLIDTQGFETTLAKTKSDYHSTIEYKFITSPVGSDGGYAYLSPADGLGINKNSDNTDWALEFLNFFFTPEISTEFALASDKIPNTADALLQYNIPENRTCDVGQVTFSYSFYKIVTTPMLSGYDDMVGISKMNKEKYMVKNEDGTFSFAFTLEEYIARLEAEFQKAKAARAVSE